jgi:hypothetical protein
VPTSFPESLSEAYAHVPPSTFQVPVVPGTPSNRKATSLIVNVSDPSAHANVLLER